MGFLDSIFGWGGEDPLAVQQRQQAQVRIDAENRAKAEAAAAAEQQRLQDEANAAALRNTVGPGDPGFQSAGPQFSALYPEGFDVSAIPGDFGAGTINANITRGRTAAQDFINNMLQRGTLSESGGAAATSALGKQEAGLRTKLGALRDTMVANERAKIRGIANEGLDVAQKTAAGGFDPGPYQGRINADISSFTSGFPGALTAGGGTGDFDLNALQLASGGVSDPRNVQIDPYAVEGGKLSSGVEDAAPPPSGKKKRTTAVF